MPVSSMITTKGYGAQIKLLGHRELSRALQAIDPELKRTMDKRIRNVAVTVQRGSAARINRRTGGGAAGYQVKRGGKGTVFGYRVINADQGGAISEVAGSRSSGNPGPVKVRKGQYKGTYRKGSGPALIRTLNSEYGPSRVIGGASSSSRIMIGVYDDIEPWAQSEIQAAVTQAEASLQSMFDAAGGI